MPPTTFVVTSLPLFGVLLEGTTPITVVPYTLDGNSLSYAPNSGFQGDDSFAYEATFADIVDTGTVFIRVRLLDCQDNAEDCDDGR